MTTYKQTTRTAAIIVAILLLSLTGFLWYKDNRDFKKKTEMDRLRQDSLISEKLLLKNEIDKMSSAILAWRNKNSSLDSALQAANLSLTEKIKIINGLRAENLTVKRLKKELKDLKEIHAKLESQMNALLAENKQLKDEVSRLKNELAEKSKPQKTETIFSLDNFKVALERKNTKLTVKAKKIKTIQISFDIKNNQKESTNETIYIVVKDADGKAINPKSNSASIHGENIAYIDSQKADISESPKKINTSLKLDSKMKAKGSLKIIVYSESMGLLATYLSPVN